MPERSARPKRETATQPTEEALTALLDQFEDALQAGDQPSGQVLLNRLLPAGRRLPDLLVRRLSEGRARVPELAIDMLTTLAGGRTLTLLRRLARDTAVSDTVRLAAQRRVGWPQRGEAKRRRAFLESLRDAETALIEATAAAGPAWPPLADLLEDVLGYLLALPAEPRLAFLRRAASAPEPPLIWLLHACLHAPDPGTARLAVEETTKLAFPGSAGALERLAATTPDETLAYTARIAAAELRRLQPGNGATQPPLLPVERVIATMVDGDGGQGVMVLRGWTPGLYLLGNYLITDVDGIKGAQGLTRVTADHLAEIRDEFEFRRVTVTEISLAAARSLLASGLAVNAARKRRLPPEFELWAPLLHEVYPPPATEPGGSVDLDDAPYAGRVDLLRKSRRLANHPFFTSWGFPADRTEAAMIDAPPPRGTRLTDTQFRPLMRVLLNPSTRERLRGRLRRQAWLLEQDGDEPARDLALATAAALADGDEKALVRVPLLRAMVERGVAAVLGVGDADPFAGLPPGLRAELEAILRGEDPPGGPWDGPA